MIAKEFAPIRRSWDAIPAADDSARTLARGRLLRALTETPPAPARARRARRLPRRRILVTIAVLLALLAAVPALSGGYDRVIHFLTGEPPKPVVDSLRGFDRGAPPGQAQHPIVGKTGKVYERETRFGLVRIWLTPTKSGGFCALFESPGPAGKPRPFSGGCFSAELRQPIEFNGLGLGTDFGVGYLEGRVHPAIVRLEVRYVNGRVQDVPLQNGFFVASIEPVRMLDLSDHPHELVGFDRSGNSVARVDLDRNFEFSGAAERPPVADVRSERAAITVPLARGAAVLNLSPSRLGGFCARVSAAGTDWAWSCGEPSGLRNPIRLGMARVPDATPERFSIVIYGVAKPDTNVVFHYEDGTEERIPLVDQNFLVVLPRQRWREGYRLSEIVTTSDGRVTLRVPVARRGDAFYVGGPDRAPGPGIVQIYNPPNLPVVARLPFTGEHGERIVFEVKRETATHWYQILIVDGKPVVGENLQWFPGGRETTIGFGGIPILSKDGRSDLSLLLGQLQKPASEARVVYGDGSTEKLQLAPLKEPLAGGITAFFAYEVTEARRAKHPLRFEALDASGGVIGRSNIPAGV